MTTKTVNPLLSSVTAPRTRKRLLPLMIGTVLLAGCAVHPHPISLDERRADLANDRRDMYSGQEAVTGPVTLEEAMARALKYNLDHRIKLMEEAVAQDQLSAANWDLLPQLTAAAGYSTRNNDLASSSEDVVTHQQSLVPSFSSERTHGTADLSLSWNILDFGVSYYSARQQADRVLAFKERRRKVVQQLMQQVRQAYWQAAGAQQLETQLNQVLKDANASLNELQQIEKENLRSPAETLATQRQLLDIIRQMQLVSDELNQAKPKLAALMNLSPGVPYNVAAPANLAAPQIPVAEDKMEETALLNRPDLMEARYNERIGVLETRKAIAKLFPGIQINLGTHYDTNRFLVNNNWRDAGISISWNLFNLLKARSIQRTADAQRELAHDQRLALNMAVLTQVHVAYYDFQARQRQFELDQRISNVDQSLLRHTQNAASVDAKGRIEAVRAEANAVVSQLRQYQSYSALQGAYGQMEATLGQDPLPETVKGHDLTSLQNAVRDAETQWQQRQLQTQTQPTTEGGQATHAG